MRAAVCGAVGMLAATTVACGGPDSSGREVEAASPSEQAQAPTPGTWEEPPVSVEELRPEARPVIDLADETDRLVVALHPNEYLTDEATISRQLARARALESDTGACIDEAADAVLDASGVARLIIDQTFAFGSDGSQQSPFPGAAAALEESDVQAADDPSVSDCREQVQAQTRFVAGGPAPERMQDLKDAGDWQEPDSDEAAVLETSMVQNCPELYAGTSETCSDLAGYLAAIVEVHRVEAASNAELLR